MFCNWFCARFSSTRVLSAGGNAPFQAPAPAPASGPGTSPDPLESGRREERRLEASDRDVSARRGESAEAGKLVNWFFERSRAVREKARGANRWAGRVLKRQSIRESFVKFCVPTNGLVVSLRVIGTELIVRVRSDGKFEVMVWSIVLRAEGQLEARDTRMERECKRERPANAEGFRVVSGLSSSITSRRLELIFIKALSGIDVISFLERSTEYTARDENTNVGTVVRLFPRQLRRRLLKESTKQSHKFEGQPSECFKIEITSRKCSKSAKIL